MSIYVRRTPRTVYRTRSSYICNGAPTARLSMKIAGFCLVNSFHSRSRCTVVNQTTNSRCCVCMLYASVKADTHDYMHSTQYNFVNYRRTHTTYDCYEQRHVVYTLNCDDEWYRQRNIWSFLFWHLNWRHRNVHASHKPSAGAYEQ